MARFEPPYAAIRTVTRRPGKTRSSPRATTAGIDIHRPYGSPWALDSPRTTRCSSGRLVSSRRGNCSGKAGPTLGRACQPAAASSASPSPISAELASASSRAATGRDLPWRLARMVKNPSSAIATGATASVASRATVAARRKPKIAARVNDLGMSHAYNEGATAAAASATAIAAPAPASLANRRQLRPSPCTIPPRLPYPIVTSRTIETITTSAP